MGDLVSENDDFQVLLRRVRAGDGQAAAELVRRYEPAIRRAARVRLVDTRLNRLLDSMDICQSVMASFFVRTALGQYELETPEQLLKLLATMTRNKLANQVKGHGAGRRDFRRIEDAAAEMTAARRGVRRDRGSGRAGPHAQQRGRRARAPGRSPPATLARRADASGTARARPRVDRDCRRAGLQARRRSASAWPARSTASLTSWDWTSRTHERDPRQRTDARLPGRPPRAQSEVAAASRARSALVDRGPPRALAARRADAGRGLSRAIPDLRRSIPPIFST